MTKRRQYSPEFKRRMFKIPCQLRIKLYLAARPGKRQQMNGLEIQLEKAKASMRAKVEHPFRRVKQQFGYAKVRYRGLAKNTNRLQVLAAFSNFLTVKLVCP